MPVRGDQLCADRASDPVPEEHRLDYIHDTRYGMVYLVTVCRHGTDEVEWRRARQVIRHGLNMITPTVVDVSPAFRTDDPSTDVAAWLIRTDVPMPRTYIGRETVSVRLIALVR